MIPVLEQLIARGELARRGFKNAVVLTYGVDLPWFERHIGRQLRIAGVRRFAVLADGRALEEAVAEDAAEIEGAGTWYSVAGIHLPASFHPKAILLTGPKAARLYVGSGNLTPSGLGRNFEIYERWDASIADGVVSRVFEDFGRYVNELVARVKPGMAHLEEVLVASFGEPVLAQPRSESSARLHGGFPGASRALLEHVPMASTPARELIMTAPFFDGGGSLAVEVARRLEARTFTVVVDLGMTNLLAPARVAIEAAGGTIKAFVDDDRRTHCKALFARGEGWALGIHGSANLSTSAWRGGNAELVVVRTGSDAAVIEHLLRAREAREVSESEWNAVAARVAVEAASRKTNDAWDQALVARAATWLGDSIEILVPNDDGTRAVLLACRIDDDEVVRVPTVVSRAGARTAQPEPERIRGRSVVVRLEAGDRVGPWLILHDPRALRRQAQARSPFDEDAKEYFQGARTADANEALLELLAAFGEDNQSQDVASPPRRASVDSKNGSDDWVWVTEADFHVAERKDEARAVPPTAESDGHPDAGRVLVRLLLGAENERSPGATDTGSDSGDDDDDDGARQPGRGRKHRTTPAATRPQTRDLGELVERTQRAYLRRLSLSGGHGTAERLLHDLVILLGAVQDAFRHGSIGDRKAARHLVAMTDALLGSAHRPLPRRLGAIPAPDREAIWQRTPLLAGATLAIYNACLATAAATGEIPDDSTFPSYRAVLWLRHLVRHCPWTDPAQLVTHVEQYLPRLRRFSVLWLADCWPLWDGLLRFEEFVSDGLRAACDLERIEKSLSDLPTGDAPEEWNVDTDGDLTVVGAGRDGRLAVGFLDLSVNDKISGYVLFDGAFQSVRDADPSRRPAVIPLAVGRRTGAQIGELLAHAGLRPLTQLERLLGGDAAAARAVALLRQLA